MIIFTNVRKSVDYKDFILQNVHPAELDKCENTLSNSEKEVRDIIVTCCNLRTLWNDSDLETKIKVQHLVFPNGIFWNQDNGCYRTPEKGLIFNIIDSVSGGL